MKFENIKITDVLCEKNHNTPYEVVGINRAENRIVIECLNNPTVPIFDMNKERAKHTFKDIE